MHTFEASKDGQLIHKTDGELRATVPPEGWDGYLKFWPEAQSVIDGLKRRSTGERGRTEAI